MGLGWHPIYEMENKSHVWNHQPDHGRLNNSTTQTRYEPYRSNLIASWLLLCLSSTSSTTQHCYLSQFRWIYPDRTTTAYRRMSKNYLFTRLKSAYLRLNQSGNPSPDPILRPCLPVDSLISILIFFLACAGSSVWSHTDTALSPPLTRCGCHWKQGAPKCVGWSFSCQEKLPQPDRVSIHGPPGSLNVLNLPASWIMPIPIMALYGANKAGCIVFWLNESR